MDDYRGSHADGSQYYEEYRPGTYRQASGARKKPPRRKRQKRGKPVWPWVLLGVLALLAVGIASMGWQVQITLDGGDRIDAEYGEPFEDPGVKARLSCSLFPKGLFSVRVKTEGTVSTDALGQSELTYRAQFLWMHAEKTRAIDVIDTTPPVITLKSDPEHRTLSNHPYEEEGYTAFDRYDGDLTDKVTSEERDGHVYYSVTDSSGNTGTAVREIQYYDPNPPELTLKGGDVFQLAVGSEYQEPGYEAVDDCDGDITDRVQVEGTVDSSTVGEYTLTYTVNGLMMGSSITEIPDKLNVEVTVNDPDASDSIAKVEVVANSGKVAYTWDNAAQLRSGKLSATLDPSYSYYFIRVTQKDGDLAVTSPVWVGESLKLGISNMVCGTATPVTDEELTLTTTFFNSEDSDATIKSLTYSIGGTVIGTDKTGYTIAKSSTLDVPFKYTPTAARVFTVQVTAVVEQGNNEYTFTKTVDLDVLNADSLVYIGIDASHYNEYVNGNYKDSMGNFGNLAADHSVRTVQLNTGADLIAACSNPKYKALILTAPSRRLADAQTNPKTYSDAELKALAAFNAAGGTVILAGWSDNYENYEVIQKNPDIKHMAETQNDVLKALGSSLRISDDATYDDVRSTADGVDKWRLYFSTYNTDNFLTSGVIVDADHPYDKLYTERFSHYGGASIYAVDTNGNPASTLPSTVSPVVYGHATTYSMDVDKDGKGGAGTPKYTYAENDNRLLVMATEQLAGKGLIVVSGAAFMSNFEVQAQLDNGAEKNYSNYRICENLVSYLNPVQLSTIDQIHQQPEEGFKYTVEGIVTSNASGHDKDTAFFDCIYIQDETGGINCFPVAGDFKIGDRVRVSGTTSSYQGERQLAVTKIEKIGEGTPVQPKVVTATQVNDLSVLGQLITLKGHVTAIEMAEGKVQTILVKDAHGKVARVFIDGYICSDTEVKDLKVGCEIAATGLASYDNTFVLADGTAIAPRIRISNRADVVCTACTCGESGGDTPKTGDSAHMVLWVSMMTVTALAGAAMVLTKKRRS